MRYRVDSIQRTQNTTNDSIDHEMVCTKAEMTEKNPLPCGSGFCQKVTL